MSCHFSSRTLVVALFIVLVIVLGFPPVDANDSETTNSQLPAAAIPDQGSEASNQANKTNFTLRWNKTIGDDEGNFYAITRDGAGRLFAAGYVNGENASDSDDALATLVNRDGTIQWVKSFGGEKKDMLFDVINTTDGFVVAGQTSSRGSGEADAWLVKLTPDGDIAWQVTVGGRRSDEFSRVVQAPDGGFLAVGSQYSFKHYEPRAIAVKVSATGRVEWHQEYSYSNSFSGAALVNDTYVLSNSHYNETLDTNDGVVLGVAPNGTVRWQRVLGGVKNEDIHSVSAVGSMAAITGSTASYGASDGAGVLGQRAWFLLMTSEGTIQINQTYPNVSFFERTIAVQGGDYLVTGGRVADNGDIGFLVHLQSDGEVLWRYRLPSWIDASIDGVTVGPEGQAFVVGESIGLATPGSAWIGKIQTQFSQTPESGSFPWILIILSVGVVGFALLVVFWYRSLTEDRTTTLSVVNEGTKASTFRARCRTEGEVKYTREGQLDPDQTSQLGSLPTDEMFEIAVTVREGPTEKQVFTPAEGSPSDVVIYLTSDAIRIIGRD